MAESKCQNHVSESKLPVETTDRGCFGFLGKKEEKPETDVVMTEEDRLTIKEELQRSHSHSSSSSDEETEGGERKKKKKKGLKEKNEGNEKEVPEEMQIPGDGAEAMEAEEKKGFLEKIKEKLPGGQHKKTEEGVLTPQPECEADGHLPEGEPKEKKGILEKIKEKLHKNGDGEVKEKEN